VTLPTLQEAKKENIMAILFTPSWEPANKKFFLPSARGRILFSMALLSRWILPSSKKWFTLLRDNQDLPGNYLG